MLLKRHNKFYVDKTCKKMGKGIEMDDHKRSKVNVPVIITFRPL